MSRLTDRLRKLETASSTPRLIVLTVNNPDTETEAAKAKHEAMTGQPISQRDLLVVIQKFAQEAA